MAWTSRALLVLPAIVLSAPARGDSGESALSADLGWATFSTPGKPTSKSMEPPAVTPDVGGALGVSYELGLSTDLSLRGEAAASLFTGGTPMKGNGTTSFAALGDVGAVFRFDVLKYVPYAFAGLGGVVTDGGALGSSGEFVLAIGGGLDYLMSRSRSFGIEGRLASFGGSVTILTIGVRGTIRWGYF